MCRVDIAFEKFICRELVFISILRCVIVPEAFAILSEAVDDVKMRSRFLVVVPKVGMFLGEKLVYGHCIVAKIINAAGCQNCFCWCANVEFAGKVISDLGFNWSCIVQKAFIAILGLNDKYERQ